MDLTIKKRNSIIASFKDKPVQTISLDGLKLTLTKDTLVPHPDTLCLIDHATRIISANRTINTVADVGTGSGIIALKLAVHFPDLSIYASDLSEQALKVAEKNSKDNKIKNIIFVQNMDGVFLSEFKKKKIDFIISNPPFVDDKEYLSTEFRSRYPETLYEPELAIRTFDEDGLTPYLEILNNSTKNKTKLFLFQCNSLNINMLSTKINAEYKCITNTLKNNNGACKYLFVNKI